MTRCEECNTWQINDVEAKATNMYNTKLRHGGQIMKVTLPTQAQTKLQGESYTAHSGTIMKVIPNTAHSGTNKIP